MACDGDCANCDIANASVQETLNTSVYPFQFHVTVSSPPEDLLWKFYRQGWAGIFVGYCRGIKVNGHVFLNGPGDMRTSPSFTPDPRKSEALTSSGFRGKTAEAIEALTALKERFERDGWTVTRYKMETVPWHPQAIKNKLEDNQYFETHFKVKGDYKWLCDYAKEANLGVSSSLYGSGNTIITLRRKWDFDRFDRARQQIENDFKFMGVQILDRVVTEFAIFDSNPHHDDDWINMENK